MNAIQRFVWGVRKVKYIKNTDDLYYNIEQSPQLVSTDYAIYFYKNKQIISNLNNTKLIKVDVIEPDIVFDYGPEFEKNVVIVVKGNEVGNNDETFYFNLQEKYEVHYLELPKRLNVKEIYAAVGYLHSPGFYDMNAGERLPSYTNYTLQNEPLKSYELL